METEENSRPAGTDFSFTLWKANIYSLPIALILFLAAWYPYKFFWGTEKIFSTFRQTQSFLLLVLLFVTGIVLHELIHAAVWIMFAKIPMKRIKFGFNLKTLTPFAHCGEPVTAKVYRIALLAPGFCLGVLPFLISLFTGNVWSFVFGMLFLITAVGDFLIYFSMWKVGSDQLVADHPERAGCRIIEESKKI